MIGMPWEGNAFEIKLYQRKDVIYYPENKHKTTDLTNEYASIKSPHENKKEQEENYEVFDLP
jgi:hypothetical protein